MQRQLERLGYECVAAADAGQALEFATERTFDAVLVDHGLPGAHGGTLTRELLRLDPLRSVVLMSGRSGEELELLAEECGAQDVLRKPFGLAELGGVIRRAIERRDLRMRTQRLELRLDRLDSSAARMAHDIQTVLAASFEDTVTAFVNAIEARDAETRNHSRRARAYTLLIARYAGVDDAQLQHIGWGALLHDIGKIAVPDRILRKPGPLTAEEWEIMRQHPVVGYELIREIAFLAEAADVVLAHHERFDGSGYPFGTVGTDIPLGARIFAIADAVETITSRRAYKAPESFATAADEIERCSGTHFDPDLVAVFRTIPRNEFRRIRDQYLELTGEIIDPRIARILEPERVRQSD